MARKIVNWCAEGFTVVDAAGVLRGYDCEREQGHSGFHDSRQCQKALQEIEDATPASEASGETKVG